MDKERMVLVLDNELIVKTLLRGSALGALPLAVVVVQSFKS